MLSGKFVLPLIAIGVGFIAALTFIRNQGEQVHQANIVPQPMVGGISRTGTMMNKEGPWPECIGKTGDACKALIEAMAHDVRGNVFVLPNNSMMTMDFRTDRVRIMVDENGLVQKAPGRG